MRTIKTKTANRYRFSVELQEKTADDWEGKLKWQPVRRMYCNITPKNARVVIDGRQEAEVVRYEVLTSWHPDGFPAVELRLVEGKRNFYVESVVDLGEDHGEHQLICTLRDGE